MASKYHHSIILISRKKTGPIRLFLSINIHAQVAVITKAKLDDIRIGGDCRCDDENPVPVVVPELRTPSPVPVKVGTDTTQAIFLSLKTAS